MVIDVNGGINLGLLYEEKLNDYSKAIKWYKKAISMGNLNGGINLGLLYEEKLKDFERATQCYENVVKQGNIGAIKNLALLYHSKNYTLKSTGYMFAMIGHPYTKERVLGLLRDDWKIDESTLKEAYQLQKTLVPNPYFDKEFEDEKPKKKTGRR